MPFAVMQTGMVRPTLEHLKNAFHGVPGLTPADAAIKGRDAFGMLVKELTSEQALGIKAGLAAQGIETETVDQATLPPLPETRHIHRLDCTPEALVIYDPLGRSFPLEWRHVLILAAGKVTVEGNQRVRTEEQKWVRQGRGMKYVTVTDYRDKWDREDKLLLEIIIAGGALRFSAVADKSSPMLFQYLGDRRTNDWTKNFALMVQDLVNSAPRAALNYGVNCLQTEAAAPFSYPTKNSFYSEILWLLWWLSRQQTPDTPG